MCTKYTVKDPAFIDFKHDESKKSNYTNYRETVKNDFKIRNNITDLKSYYLIEKATIKIKDEDNKISTWGYLTITTS